MKALTYLSLLVLLIALSFLGFLIGGVDYTSDLPQTKRCSPGTSFRLAPHLPEVDTTISINNFPHQVYLDSANWCSITPIIENLMTMDTLYPNDEINHQVILSTVLTQKLTERWKQSFTHYNPDSLIILIHWAEQFFHYANLDQKHGKFHRIVYRYWFNFITTRLNQYAEDSPTIKYDYKFRYLVSLCHSKQFSPPVGNTKVEKVFYNILDSNWAYLFNRFWNSTGPSIKFLVALLSLFQAYAFWCIIKVSSLSRHKSIN